MALHHFVPQFYLKNFALGHNDPRVWVYRRKGEPQRLPIKTIAAVQGFYEVTEVATGKKSEVVEKLFAQLEGEAKPLIDKLLSADSLIAFSGDEFSLMSYFMATLHLRGRSFRTKAHNLRTEFFKRWLKEEAKDREGFKALAEAAGYELNDERLDESLLLLSNFDEHFTINVKRGDEGALLQTIFENAKQLSETIFYKTWRLCESREKIFVTSDNPVTVMQYSNVPHQEVRGVITGIIALPLSPFRCLLLEPGRIRRQIPLVALSRRAVSQVNESTMFNAHREVYSRFRSPATKKAFHKTVEGWSEELQHSDELFGGMISEVRGKQHQNSQ